MYFFIRPHTCFLCRHMFFSIGQKTQYAAIQKIRVGLPFTIGRQLISTKDLDDVEVRRPNCERPNIKKVHKEKTQHRAKRIAVTGRVFTRSTFLSKEKKRWWACVFFGAKKHKEPALRRKTKRHLFSLDSWISFATIWRLPLFGFLPSCWRES